MLAKPVGEGALTKPEAWTLARVAKVPPCETGVIPTKAKSLTPNGMLSLVRKFQSNVRVKPALTVTVRLRAAPLATVPLPKASRLPGVAPRKDSRWEVGAPAVLLTRASKSPSVGPVPKEEVRVPALPKVAQLVRSPSNPPFGTAAP